MINLCINIGFNVNNILLIAYSGYTGQNLVNKYEDDDFSNINKMEWYKGKTLIESLDELKPPKRTFDGPLIISIFQKDKITGCGTVLEGKILSGKLDKEIVLCIPKLVNTQIEKKTSSWIEMNHKICDEAFAGDIIGFTIGGAIRDIYFTYLVFDEKLMTKFKIAKNLRVKILMINKDTKLKIGSVLTLFCYTLNVPIKIIKIEYLVDETNKILEKEPREIKNGERAFIIINVIIKEKDYKKLNQVSYFEKYTKNQNLGSFILCNRDLIAVGNIYDINVET